MNQGCTEPRHFFTRSSRWPLKSRRRLLSEFEPKLSKFIYMESGENTILGLGIATEPAATSMPLFELPYFDSEGILGGSPQCSLSVTTPDMQGIRWRVSLPFPSYPSFTQGPLPSAPFRIHTGSSAVTNMSRVRLYEGAQQVYLEKHERSKENCQHETKSDTRETH